MTIETLTSVFLPYSIGSMRRAIAIARDYAHRRRAFGKLLADQPLHLATLAELDVALRGCVFFTFEAIALLGKRTQQTPDSQMLAHDIPHIYIHNLNNHR